MGDSDLILAMFSTMRSPISIILELNEIGECIV